MTIIAQFCETPDNCGCTPPATAEYDVEITAGSFSKTIQIEGTAPFTIKNISVDTWCNVSYNNGLNISGSISSGDHKQVIEVSNQCGTGIIVINISVSVECSGNIVKNIPIKNGEVSETIRVPDGSILSYSVGTATVNLYGNDLVISGNASPGAYQVLMDDSCNTVISGNFYECIAPKLIGTIGVADFERGTPATFSWKISGNNIKTKGEILPAGFEVSTTESGSQTTVTISGTPPQNTGAGTMTVIAYNECGQITLTQKYTQVACKGIRITGEEGSSIFKEDVAGSYCKIIEGYEPMSIVSFTDVPLGMNVTLDKVATNKYKLCLSGTPIKDPCSDSTSTTNCSCSTVTVRNECGDVEVSMCTSTTVEIPKPTYCIGIVKLSKTTVTNIFQIEVYGIMPNSDLKFYNANILKYTADSSGYIKTNFWSDGSGNCVKIAHETCGLVIVNSPISIECENEVYYG